MLAKESSVKYPEPLSYLLLSFSAGTRKLPVTSSCFVRYIFLSFISDNDISAALLDIRFSYCTDLAVRFLVLSTGSG